MTYLWVALLGYIIGSIPFGVLMARLFGLGDLRQTGSGNIGATNVLRTGNKLAAALTLLLDMAKGTAASLGVWLLLGNPQAAAIAALAAMVGHCFPVWLKFRGGKGVATYIGALLGIHSLLFLLFAAVWLGLAFTRRVSSLSALSASAAVALGGLFLPELNGTVQLCLFAMTALLWWQHRANIKRLSDGTEPKIGK